MNRERQYFVNAELVYIILRVSLCPNTNIAITLAHKKWEEDKNKKQHRPKNITNTNTK